MEGDRLGKTVQDSHCKGSFSFPLSLFLSFSLRIDFWLVIAIRILSLSLSLSLSLFLQCCKAMKMAAIRERVLSLSLLLLLLLLLLRETEALKANIVLAAVGRSGSTFTEHVLSTLPNVRLTKRKKERGKGDLTHSVSLFCIRLQTFLMDEPYRKISPMASDVTDEAELQKHVTHSYAK
jgi:hypothetical protein